MISYINEYFFETKGLFIVLRTKILSVNLLFIVCHFDGALMLFFRYCFLFLNKEKKLLVVTNVF